MEQENGLAHCPHCGSTTLDRGTMSAEVRFFRTGQWLSTGWDVQAFVCLDCGHVTQYMSADYLAQLREKNGLPPRRTEP